MLKRAPAVLAALLVLMLVSTASTPAGACPLHRTALTPFDAWFPGLGAGLTWLFDAAVAEAVGFRPQVDPVEVDRPPSEVGRWLEPRPWPVIGIHAAVLPTARLLHFAYPYVFSGGSRAQVWWPRRDLFRDVTWSSDLFCGGHAFLADGQLLVTGGNDSTGCGTRGRRFTHLFDPFTGRWSEGPEMERERWYPGTLTLADGRVLIVSGLDDECRINAQMEIYATDGAIERVPEGDRPLELYPRLHLLPDGRVAHVGPESETWTFDPDARVWEELAGTRLGHPRFEGTSFLVPGRPRQVMICGGFEDYDRLPTASCERIDFRRRTPRWRPTAPMHFARAHPDAVLLPDATVLMVGGGQVGLYEEPVLNAELFDPRTGKWTLLPPQVHGRMYHSTTVLLPDGRVLSAGQDDDAGDGVQSGDWAEIYEPAYLFRGRRPRIARAPRRADYGARFTVRSPQAADVARVVLIRPAAMTHSVNNSQRYVRLAFERTGDRTLSVTAPAHGGFAPPGYYMLFLVDADGVPSRARMIRLDAAS